MKHHYFTLSLIFVVAVVLTACDGDSSTIAWPTPEGSKLDTSYSGALPSYLILALGTMKLDSTADAVTPEQAQELLTLWQALRSSINTGGTGQAEVGTLMLQIEDTLTADQIAAINAMKITQGDMRSWALANGVGTGAPSADMQATQQALVKSGQIGKGGIALLDAIVKYLEERQ
jgi:hypothetical protein